MNSFELGKVAPVAFLTVAALGACSTGAEIPLRTDMRTADVVPETRFDYEYGGGRYTLPNYGSRVPSQPREVKIAYGRLHMTLLYTEILLQSQIQTLLPRLPMEF